MNLAAIFQVLAHLNDFEIIGYGGHLVFKTRPKLFSGKTFAGNDFSWSDLHSEAVVPIIREK